MDASNSAMSTQVITQEPDQQSEITVCITQQSVVQITLTGPSLVLSIIAIIIGIQILQPSLTCTLLVLAPVPWIIHNDYQNFLSLGPGGTPATFLGYLKITYLRLFALSDPYSPATFTESIYPTTGYYQRVQSWLPFRSGSRPKIAGIAPQRQLDQPGCKKMYQMLRASLENLAVQNPESFRIGTSCFEKKGLALFARDPINATCRGEVCHVHHSDRSLHLNLHPDDAKLILERGWGERHPLARGGWMKAYVPREFVMVYAPRNRMELDAVCRIIEAAGFWVSGKQFEVGIKPECLPDKHSQ
ncbi:hypothetical protein LHYA1_G006618 [Lachnellula hyalina]|uniref:Luciferase domain-containing protein n=1 Tax=Lachnellula hyalina TaxID=1316788 RepID=A0A8H8QZ69_9HELO|nr:uncharacterized protein LHYA1_G006618 [Lachnellula hyalina]TVY24465.1 hypothetical protein LHYA1_G006618 [Lachnellula hyalina]